MKRIISIVLILLSVNVYSQKHTEVIGSMQDSMIMLNKDDVDVINKVFHEKVELIKLDSLNSKLIDNYTEIINSQHNVIRLKDSVLINDIKMISNLEDNVISLKEDLSNSNKELKKETKFKRFWRSTTGIATLSILVLLLI